MLDEYTIRYEDQIKIRELESKIKQITDENKTLSSQVTRLKIKLARHQGEDDQKRAKNLAKLVTQCDSCEGTGENWCDMEQGDGHFDACPECHGVGFSL